MKINNQVKGHLKCSANGVLIYDDHNEIKPDAKKHILKSLINNTQLSTFRLVDSSNDTILDWGIDDRTFNDTDITLTLSSPSIPVTGGPILLSKFQLLDQDAGEVFAEVILDMPSIILDSTNLDITWILTI